MRYFRADEIGGTALKSTADGTFLIVVVEITNPQSNIITIPRRDFRVRSPDTWHQYEEDASSGIDNDDRIDEESLVNAPVRPNSSRVGAVAFDVNPDSSYRVWITPTGGNEDHFVPVGEISTVRRL